MVKTLTKVVVLALAVPFLLGLHPRAFAAKKHVAKVKRADLASETEASKYPLKIYTPIPASFSFQYPKNFKPAVSLQSTVEFWRNVFANYDLHQTILHDNQNFDLIYGVLDFESLEKDVMDGAREKKALRSKIEGIKKARLAEMLLRFAEGQKPETSGEHLIYNLFKNIHESDKFAAAAERVRGQWGQKSKFEAGLILSGRWMPTIQKIFEAGGAPKEVAYLVFVESMFQMGAVSKVGAVGPWQFMPATARLQKLVIDRYMDERLDPLIGAAGAARLLRKNYELLTSWPLAINAYNTGPMRMKKAVNQLGTKNIDVIIRHFTDRGYQFASRNFYPEFLAAMEVAQRHHKYFSGLDLEKPIAFDEVRIPYNLSLYDLASTAGTDVGVLKDLNPAYEERNFRRGTLLPKGYTIRVPHTKGNFFLAAIEDLWSKQQMAKWHLVKKGDTLHKIARQYGTSVQRVQSFNGLLGLNLLPGQMLKIPGPSAQVVLETHQ